MSISEEFELISDDDLGFSSTDVDSFDVDVADFRDQEGLTYPAMLLTRVLFMDSLLVLKSQKRSSYREIPVWLELDGGEGYQEMGTLQLTSDILLLLRHLHIGVTMYWSYDIVETLDLSNPAVLEKYI